jgi:cytochrome c-type protein NapC
MLPHDMFALLALGTAVLATPFLVWYLVRRPTLTRATKVVLFLGIGFFPLLTAGSGNVAGFEATKEKRFCGSCHVMTPYARDTEDPNSTTLASRHSRNEQFGHESCYTCHADYGMFGTVVTKAGGMRHVYEYVFNFHQLSFAAAEPKIHIRKPFPNSTCMRCHSTSVPSWNKIGEHAALLDELRTNQVTCVGGCHGPAHPFKPVPARQLPLPVTDEEEAP